MKSRQASAAATSTCAVAATSRAWCTASPGRSSVLDGMQAQYEHSPPTSSPLDQGHPQAAVGQLAGAVLARRAGAHDDHVVVVARSCAGRLGASLVHHVVHGRATARRSPEGLPAGKRLPRRAHRGIIGTARHPAPFGHARGGTRHGVPRHHDHPRSGGDVGSRRPGRPRPRVRTIGRARAHRDTCCACGARHCSRASGARSACSPPTTTGSSRRSSPRCRCGCGAPMR